MADLVHCIYSSEATTPVDTASLLALLDAARRNNARLGVTGMLLHVEGSFFQILEGAPAEVDRLFERIAQDPRHQRVIRIIDEPIAHRSFADWTMAFASRTPAEVAAIVGTNDFFGAGTALSGLTQGRAKKLLTAFARGRWRAAGASERLAV